MCFSTYIYTFTYTYTCTRTYTYTFTYTYTYSVCAYLSTCLSIYLRICISVCPQSMTSPTSACGNLTHSGFVSVALAGPKLTLTVTPMSPSLSLHSTSQCQYRSPSFRAPLPAVPPPPPATSRRAWSKIASRHLRRKSLRGSFHSKPALGGLAPAEGLDARRSFHPKPEALETLKPKSLNPAPLDPKPEAPKPYTPKPYTPKA